MNRHHSSLRITKIIYMTKKNVNVEVITQLKQPSGYVLMEEI